MLTTSMQLPGVGQLGLYRAADISSGVHVSTTRHLGRVSPRAPRLPLIRFTAHVIWISKSPGSARGLCKRPVKSFHFSSARNQEQQSSR